MITDMMEVHKAFFDKHDGLEIGEVAVPCKFFNAQPEMKDTPEYPSIVIQPFIPKITNRVYVNGKMIYDDQEGTVKEQKPPKRFKFTYQVTAYSNRFDHAMILYRLLYDLFSERRGQTWLTIDGDNYEILLVDQQELPDIGAGTFRYDFVYELYVPIYTADVVNGPPIVDWEIRTETSTENLAE
ncbi:MAG: hypothetical protein V1799_07470 [bacterium]